MVLETEHCWDSVEDALERTSTLMLWVTWPVVSAYFFLLFFSTCFVESLLYGPLLHLLNPLALIPNIFTWVFGFTVVVPSIVVSNFLRLILRMRPSDDSYTKTSKNWRLNIYLNTCNDDFKTTHVQLPHKKLEDRDSDTLSQFPRTARGSIRNSLAFKGMLSHRRSTFVDNSTGENIALDSEQEKRVKRVSRFRISLYEKTEQDLSASGLFTPAEIEDSGFSRKSLSMLSFTEQCPTLGSLSEDDDDAIDGEKKKKLI